MNINNFIFAGESLSSFDFIVCNFSGSGGFNTINGSSQKECSFVDMANGRKKISTGIKYNDAIKIEMDICKNPHGGAGRYITQNEFSDIISWLSREKMDWLELEYSDGCFDRTFYHGLFNYDVVEHKGKPVGFTLEFLTDSPFGFSEEYTKKITLEHNSPVAIIEPTSSYLNTYPSRFAITPKEAGNLTISNKEAGYDCTILNCSADETIIIDCESKVICTSDEDHSKLCNDFNYVFPFLVSKKNTFSSNVPCVIEMTYRNKMQIIF